MPRRRISHATGSSGIRMNPRWKGGVTFTVEVHTPESTVTEKLGEKQKGNESQKSRRGLNGDPTALIDAQWINNTHTSYLAAPSSYSLCSTVKALSLEEENTLLQFRDKVNNCNANKVMSTEGYNSNSNAKKKLVSTQEVKKTHLLSCFLGVLLLTPPGYCFTQQGHSLKDIDRKHGVLSFFPPSQFLSLKKEPRKRANRIQTVKTATLTHKHRQEPNQAGLSLLAVIQNRHLSFYSTSWLTGEGTH